MLVGVGVIQAQSTVQSDRHPHPVSNPCQLTHLTLLPRVRVKWFLQTNVFNEILLALCLPWHSLSGPIHTGRGTRRARKFQCFSFDVACVQCGHPHSHQQVLFACVMLRVASRVDWASGCSVPFARITVFVANSNNHKTRPEPCQLGCC